ncbi:MAG: NAD(P)H-dependent oxidoreductase [Oscillospiraceae bacterium]|jgi:multimeric flavodoxin WrbA|nr:NAD(P)H-dependent oxidoreductase [Oscillospiraceae bacterium]
MKVTIIHGSPRKGNTYRATQIFKDELAKRGGIEFTELSMPQAIPEFCVGCQVCLGNPREKCPHERYVTPVLDAILDADALIIGSPHYGATSMPAGLKNFFDHLDFLTLTVAPRAEMFRKKAFIITTGTGSKSVIRTIAGCLKNWGVNRVYSTGFRMLTDKWDKLSEPKLAKVENSLKKKAGKFYLAKKRRPHLSTVFMYHISKIILKNFAGAETYSYKYWDANDWFRKRPF